MNFNELMTLKTSDIENLITIYLPEENGYAKTVIEAMNYSLLAGGKRLRPMLMKETYILFGGDLKVIEPFMVAMEMIHTYSLVHDDLPAMDNDEYRRGRKTTHVVYGESMAILAGDALLNLAYEVASSAFDITDNYQNVAKSLQVLSKKAGIYGMIAGQTADIEAENSSIQSLDQLLFIHLNKTAALMEGAMMIGAILAGAKAEEIEIIEKVAQNIGLAFQIQDDILDLTSSLEVLGKQTGSDLKNNKVTYVSMNGLDKAKEDVKSLSDEAINLLKSLDKENVFLQQLLVNLITRDK